jgi:adenylyl-sulfate kinase
MNNIVWHKYSINKADRAAKNQQRPVVIWFTGLSGSGKSTLAEALEKTLFAEGARCYLLDGDNVRHGLNKDLGFGDTDRVENIRRVGEVAKLMADAGLIVLAAFISPFQADRSMVRNILQEGEFIEVYMETPLSVCEQRDPKGLYKKARAGQIPHFTGIDSPYETPECPEIHIDTSTQSVESGIDQIMTHLRSQGYLPAYAK